MVWYYKGLVIHLNDQMPNGNFPVLFGVTIVLSVLGRDLYNPRIHSDKIIVTKLSHLAQFRGRFVEHPSRT
jgi:hypothetical protein